jgi:hypothetical protein
MSSDRRENVYCMMRPLIQHLALVAIASLTVACQRGATVEGDLAVGGTRGAYRTVTLVRNPADSLTSAIDALCKADRADVQRRTERIQTLQAGAERFKQTRGGSSAAQIARSDSVQKYRQAALEAERLMNYGRDTTPRKIMALLKAATDTQVEADDNGHFRFAKRKPGKYLLYTEWLAATGDKELLAEVDASDGGKKTLNLDQSTVSTRLRCR